MKSKVYLFTSPTCPNCPPAKKFIEALSKKRKDFDYEELNSFDNHAIKLAKEFEVRAVPTFIIKGPKFENNIGYVGLPSNDRFNELLDISQGIEKKKVKKSKDRVIKIGKFKIKF